MIGISLVSLSLSRTLSLSCAVRDALSAAGTERGWQGSAGVQGMLWWLVTFCQTVLGDICNSAVPALVCPPGLVSSAQLVPKAMTPVPPVIGHFSLSLSASSSSVSLYQPPHIHLGHQYF